VKLKHTIFISLFWVVLVTVSFLANRSSIISSTREIIKKKAQATFNQIVIARLWNSMQGGVYAVITDDNLPNAYLKDSLRDIITTKGLKLTKINPAYMTRQMSEITTDNMSFHLTSQNPIRPENKADEWESKALKSFENDSLEILELQTWGDEIYYRYMAPLFIEESCLECHAKQGYSLGQVRGGLSVSFPASLYINSQAKQIYWSFYTHLIILILIVFGVRLYYKLVHRHYIELERKNGALEKSSQSLIEANINLNLANAKKDRFFSIIAHDLKSPFNSLIGFSEMLLSSKDEIDDQEKMEIVAMINKTSRRSFSLLVNLLDWSQSETNTISHKPQRVNAKLVSDEVIDILGGSAKSKGIILVSTLTDSDMVFADINMLKSILLNLLSNAIKFSGKGNLISLSCNAQINGCEFQIKDQGVGMSKKQISQLFSIENDISTLGTAKEPGTGLGLILCKEFIDKHKGSLSVESQLNIGTIVIFFLPHDINTTK